MEMEREKWVMFYLNGRALGGYTVQGTFPGELEATKESLAAEYGCKPEDIEVETKYLLKAEKK